MNCEFCQSPVHIWFQCPKKPDGWMPARLAKKSADGLPRAKGDIPSVASTVLDAKQRTVGINATGSQQDAMTMAPVDTNSEPLKLPVGEKQPRTSQPQGTRNEGMPAKFDKKAWQREYMRGYMQRRRAADKLKDKP